MSGPTRAELVPAFVLHTRPYTDSRSLVELFTESGGRLGAVARVQKKQSRFGLLRPFLPLVVSWSGKSDLKTLTQVEARAGALLQQGQALFCGLYLNELLLRVLPPGDAHPHLFQEYQAALQALSQPAALEPTLREFEMTLLAELGYAIPFDGEALSGETLAEDKLYLYDAEQGFISAQQGEIAESPHRRNQYFRGAHLIGVHQRRWDEPGVAQAAKQLCRAALHPLLGDKPLKSRELFR